MGWSLRTLLICQYWHQDLGRVARPHEGWVSPNFLRSAEWSLDWVYTFDLEKEIFTVNNGAHFELDKIPRNDTWIEALADGLLGDKIVVPGRVPVESLTSLLVEVSSNKAEMTAEGAAMGKWTLPWLSLFLRVTKILHSALNYVKRSSILKKSMISKALNDMARSFGTFSPCFKIPWTAHYQRHCFNGILKTFRFAS